MTTIKFSVHRNPRKNAEGQDTYQVRQECGGTIDTQEMEEQLKRQGVVRREVMETALTVLREQLMEYLLDNKRLHLDGIGTFFLKIGFRERKDEDGNPLAVSFTDPKDITGNDVAVEGVGFMPDKQFMRSMNSVPTHFENVTGRGRVGHSIEYTRETIETLLSDYLSTHDSITSGTMMREFGLTEYMSRKWIAELTSGPAPFLVEGKVGRVHFYRLS